MILSGITVATLLWANLSNWYVWIVLFVTLSFGAIGFYDDYLKVTNGGTSGLLRPVAAAGGDRRRRHRHPRRDLARHPRLLLVADGAFLQDRRHPARASSSSWSASS